MSNYTIETDLLTKRYGSVLAVDSVSLRVKPGEIYGFLGLNGAGKTTTIRALPGMIRPSGGHVKILGETVAVDRAIVFAIVTAWVFGREFSDRTWWRNTDHAI